MTQRPAILIVANPTSGRGRGRRTAEAVSADLADRGFTVCVRFTNATGDAEGITSDIVQREMDRFGIVVACGGDGTVQEVANALVSGNGSSGSAVPALGLAPAGRCNDFARAMGVSRSPEQIATTLAEGRATPIDLGCVNGRYFCTVSTIGIDAEVSSYVDTNPMPIRGTAAYLFAACRVLGRYTPRELRISGHFGVIDRPVFLASTANTSSYGGAIPIVPNADPTDGLLDLCVIDAMSVGRALRLIPSVLVGHHLAHAEVRIERTERITIEAEDRLEIWADGERVARTPATLCIAPSAIRVMLAPNPNHARRANQRERRMNVER